MDKNELEFQNIYSTFQPKIRRYLERLIGENEAKEGGFQFASGDFQKMFEMMSKCCDGKTDVPDCCSEMRRRWDESGSKSKRKNEEKSS